MATFPSIVGVAVTVLAAGSSHNIGIPGGARGDRLLAFVCFDGAPTLTWPAGYGSIQATTADPDSQVTSAVRYRDTDGTEGATFQVTIGASSEPGVGIVYRIANYDRYSLPEAATAVTTATGTPTSTPDPPSLTPSWGSADTLWIWFEAHDAGNVTLNAATHYGRFEQMVEERSGSVGASDVGSSSGAIAATASSRDPAAIALSGNQEWVINTFAIKGVGTIHAPIFSPSTMIR